MSCKVLTKNVTSIDTFIHNPCGILSKTEDGTIAVFADNMPVFYAITTTRLAQLLDLEARFTHSITDVMLNTQLFEDSIDIPTIPIGKFAMYNDWQPDTNFQRQAALWGIHLIKPVTPEELNAFISWWQAEGKVFTHIQWQQKLARSLQISRSNIHDHKRDINIFSQPDKKIPHGFRGAE